MRHLRGESATGNNPRGEKCIGGFSEKWERKIQGAKPDRTKNRSGLKWEGTTPAIAVGALAASK